MSEGSIEIKQTLSMTVTDLAREKLKLFLGEERSLDQYGVRVKVEAGGCSGAQYAMEFAGGAQEDEVTLVSNGVQVFLQPDKAPLLNGLTIDFLDELMGGGFKITNPNATSSCACGKSFSA